MTDDEIPKGLSDAVKRCVNEILDVVVPYPDYSLAQQGALKVILYMLDVKLPMGVLVMANPGMGKTLFLSLIKRSLAIHASPLKLDRPVLELVLDSAVDVYQLAGKMMLALGYPALPMRPTLPNMTTMIDTAIERLKPVALLIDEGQHVCDGKNRENTARTLTDWLKVRMDRHNLPVIMTGTRTLETISEINSQFVSRASAKYFINPFAYGDAWRQVLAAIAGSVRSIDLESLSAIGVSRLVHDAAQGNMRDLKKLLVFSCIRAIDEGATQLTTKHLAEGFDDAFGGQGGKVNPFRKAVEKGKP